MTFNNRWVYNKQNVKGMVIIMKKLISNYLFTVIYQLLLIITPFITTPYISRIFKPEGVGIEAYVSSIVQLFVVFISLSFALYGSRQIASKQSQKEISFEFWTIFAFKIISSLIVLLVYFVYIRTVTEYLDLFLINLLTLAANIIDTSWYFFGREEIKKISIRNIIVKITGIILIFTVINDYNDLDLYVLINAGTLFIGQLIMWIPLLKDVSWVKITINDILRHTKPIMILFLPQIMIQVYSLANKIVLGNVSGEVEVGYFNQAYKIITIALGVISSFGTVMLPRMSSEFSLGNKEEMKKYINFALQLILMITLPMTLGMMAISPNFVTWFLGKDFSPVIQLLFIMSPVIFFVGLANVFGIQILIGTNQQNKYSVSVTIGAILSLIINLILIKPFGSAATAVALLVAEASGALIQMYLTRKYFDMKNFLGLFIKYFVLSIALYLVVVLIGKCLPISSILLTLLQIFAGIFVYLLGLIVIKDPVTVKITLFIKNKLNRGEKLTRKKTRF
ncbi:oligosaccharide flippase family protein [Caldifermentibacillus hisashii]|uniref:oligosaccharide flippase family protein n=1 Tax=Caldifermentibacillus hisashii TaxID=996558 RepID=UPI0022B95688|nr:oligosaccharide flippase family protein [Caldifermentibacillus hisashii]MEC5271316.1 oligosaccharide flippase family protein [Caldifermentibacillus hisashii]